MAKDNVIVGIDVGSAKVASVIAQLPADGPPNVIGVSQVPSRGIRKSQVVDIEEAVLAISESLEAAERMAGYSVNRALVLVGGTHIECQNSKGVVAVATSGGEITADDVTRVIEAARAVSLPSSKEIIHVIPRHFTVDGQTGIKDPVGMTGVRLEVDTHIITGAATSLRNVAKCVQEVGIDVEGLVFSGLASAQSVLTDTEKELGVVLVDMGAGVTSVSVFVDGALSHSAVLPVGAKNITNDLAIGLRVSLETAEKIKLALSAPVKTLVHPEGQETEEKNEEKKKDDEDILNLADIGLTEDIKKVSKKTLVDGIAKPRIKEIINMVKIEIVRSGFGGLTPAGVILTGGGAQTLGIAEITKHELAMPVRIGTPTGATGLIDEITSPQFASTLGLVLYGAQLTEEGQARLPLVGRVEIKGLVGKGVDWIKSLLP